MRLIYLGAAWLLGLYLGFTSFSHLIWVYLLIISGLLFLVVTRRLKAALIGILCLGLLAAGFVRGQSVVVHSADQNLSQFNGRGSVEITGTIQSDPEILDKGVRFTFDVAQVSANGLSNPASGQALIYSSLLPPRNNSRPFPYWRYGDTLKIRGRLEAAQDVKIPGYRDYLANQGITSILRFPERITFLAPGSNPILSLIYELRTALSGSLRTALREPEASLAQGILLGIRSSIPKALSDAFAHTGTTHVLAISGQNLTILAGLLTGLGIWLLGRRRQLYILLALAMVWFYSILTGFVPSVLRATVMATIFLAAHLLGRPRSGGPALLFAAGVMVGWQPSILFDISFQLSFLAMLGLIYLAPSLQALWAGLSGENWWGKTLVLVMDSLAVSLAATLFTLPVLVYRFHTISLVNLPATLLLLPFLPAIILLSGATALVGLLAPAFAQVIAWVAWLPLAYMVAVVTAFDNLPLAFLSTSSVGTGTLVGYYGALALVTWVAGNPGTRFQALKRVVFHSFPNPLVASGITFSWPKKLIVVVLMVASFLTWMAIIYAPDGRLHLTFFGPEEGEAVLIQTPGGKTILIGGGPSPGKINLALGKTLPFWEKRLDLVILTSPDSSHLPGLINVLRRYRIGQILEPEMSRDARAKLPATYYEWRREVKNQNIPVVTAVAGQWVDLGKGYKLEVLAGPDGIVSERLANRSAPIMAIRVKAGDDINFLVAAPDREDEIRYLNARRVDLKSTVLRASRNQAATNALLEMGAPQIVVSFKTGDQSGKSERPASAPSDVEVYNVDSAHSVEFVTDSEHLWLKVHR